MNQSDRFQLIKDQTVILWLTFGRKLDPENDGRHLAIVQDYDVALRRVPDGKLLSIYEQAKSMDRRPKPSDMANLWRPSSSKDPNQVEPFKPDFRQWLSDFAAMAEFVYCNTKDRNYQLISEICDQAYMQSKGARIILEGLRSTADCVNLIHQWFFDAGIPITTSTDVAQMVKQQRESRYGGAKDLTSLTTLPSNA